MAKTKKKQPRRFTFGKYSGQTIMSVIEKDPAYVLWVHNNTSRGFTTKEIRHLNHVWKHRFGTYAVLTYEIAAKMTYSGGNAALCGRVLEDIRTTDLRKTVAPECPDLKEAIDIVVAERRWHRAVHSFVYATRRTPVFQSDDI